MPTETDQNSLQTSANEMKSLSYRKKYWPVALSFLTALIITSAVINSYLQRRALINLFKQEMSYTIKSLNQFGWDIAYDNVEFNALYPFKLTVFENLKLYSRTQNRALNFEKLFLTNGFFTPTELRIRSEGAISLVFDGNTHKINFKYNDVIIDLPNDKTAKDFTFRVQNFSISDWAEINEINFAAKFITPQHINEQAPFIKAHLDIHNIKLNGLLDYPLGQNIERIYTSAEAVGEIKTEKDFRQEIHEWLSRGGHIVLKEFNLSWSPLLMVGKGELSFNEKLRPVLQLNTSSKALLELIDDLESKEWLDNKGTFVAKILLNNKAYKADTADRHLTVTTPISVQDDALLIEKIAVKKL